MNWSDIWLVQQHTLPFNFLFCFFVSLWSSSSSRWWPDVCWSDREAGIRKKKLGQVNFVWCMVYIIYRILFNNNNNQPEQWTRKVIVCGGHELFNNKKKKKKKMEKFRNEGDNRRIESKNQKLKISKYEKPMGNVGDNLPILRKKHWSVCCCCCFSTVDDFFLIWIPKRRDVILLLLPYDYYYHKTKYLSSLNPDNQKTNQKN